MLHPDLHRLQEQYNQVLDEYESGNLTYDVALSTLQAMSVIDGNGYIWTIDSASGAFLRAVPGDAPYAADPGEFTPAQIPSQGSARWASQQDLMSPPAHLASRPGQQYGQPPAQQPQYGQPPMHQGPFSDDEEEMYTPMMQRRQSNQERSSIQAKLKGFSLPPIIEKNKKFAIIAAILLVLFVGIKVSQKGGSQEATIPPASTIPPATQPVDQTLPPATLPPEQTLPAQDPNLPPSTEPAALVAKMVSGDRAMVQSIIINSTDLTKVALYTARYKGYASTGFSLVFDTPVLTDGKVFSNLSLIDTASQQTFKTVKVRLIKGDDGIWRLNNFVEFEN
jgi:hypothetical protein